MKHKDVEGEAMFKTRSITFFAGGLLAISLMAPCAWGSIGAASLYVEGANSTPTHFDILYDAVCTAQLIGVTTEEAGDPLPAELDVWVKSSQMGFNTLLTAVRLGDSSDYEFVYEPPDFPCGTTIVAYIELGNNANNDLADDGILNGSGTAASGFRFVDDDGVPIDCTTAMEESAWSAVKYLYR